LLFSGAVLTAGFWADARESERAAKEAAINILRVLIFTKLAKIANFGLSHAKNP
jgi:hypothetical protein